MKAATSIAAALLLATAAASLVAARFDPYEMLCLVNKERVRRGLRPLGYSGRLEDAAQGHSDYQARKRRMGHSGSGGSDPAKRISRAGYDWTDVGENVAYGYEDSRECMEHWMRSPGHKKNILSSRFKQFGTAVAYSRDGQPYYTQDFADDGRSHPRYPTCPGRGDDDYGYGDYEDEDYEEDSYDSYGSYGHDDDSYGSYGGYEDDYETYDSYYGDSYYGDEDNYWGSGYGSYYYDDEDSYWGSHYYDDEDSYWGSHYDTYYGSHGDDEWYSDDDEWYSDEDEWYED